MTRHDLIAYAGFGVAAWLVLALASEHRRASPSGPQSIAEVARIADELGLHHRSDPLSGEVRNRLVISDRPASWERVNNVRFGLPEHPCWRGTVAASTPWRCFARYCDPDHGVIWGEVFLYGDPALIRKLVAAYPGGSIRP